MSETHVTVEWNREDFKPPQDYLVVDRPKLGGIRYYLIKRKVDGDDVFYLFPGVTSMLKSIFGKEDTLVKWLATYPGGYEAAMKYSELRADYGSAMHGMVSEVTRKPFESQKEFEDQFRIILASYGRDEHFNDWIDSAKRDMMAWLQWYRDWNVEPIFSELPLVSFEHGIAGQIDYLCYMDQKDYGRTAYKRFESSSETLSGYDLSDGAEIQEGRLNRTLIALFNAMHDMGIRDPKKQKGRLVEIAGENVVPYLREAYEKCMEKLGERQRILTMPDWKFGNSISYVTYTRQIKIYDKILLKENYPNIEVHSTWNWRPTDWKKSPGYEFKEKEMDDEELAHIMGLYKFNPMRDRYVTDYTGGYKPGEIPGMERLPALEYFRMKYLQSIEKAP